MLSRPGSAYVFTRSGSTWTQQAKLTASDAAAGDLFGDPVSVSGDTAVVGAYGNDDAGSWSGSAYVFTRSGGVWTQQAKLTASDAAADDWFGISVSVSGDTAVVGSDWDDDAGRNSGSAYVFKRNGSTWTQQAKLTASDAAEGDWFGVSVSVWGDTAVVGSSFDDDAGLYSGSAYVFDLALPAAPVVSSFSINSGATSTTNWTVTLKNTCANWPTQYMASESSSFSGASWQTYSAAPNFMLSSGSGTKTVYFKAKNSGGESAVVGDTITLDEPTAAGAAWMLFD
jgi:hypothetical protein